MIPRPYRILAFGRSTVTKGRGKRARQVVQGYGYVGWNPDECARLMFDPGRLQGDGTFCWPGIHAARAAAMAELAKPEIHQVSVRTNQDRCVYLFNKHSDGRISGYVPDREY